MYMLCETGVCSGNKLAIETKRSVRPCAVRASLPKSSSTGIACRKPLGLSAGLFILRSRPQTQRSMKIFLTS